MVFFGEGGVSGVEVGRGGGDVKDADVVGKDAVEGAEKEGQVGRCGGKVSDLAAGMDASVGAARGDDGSFLFEGKCERLFDESLDGEAIGLDLPTTIASAVVGDE